MSQYILSLTVLGFVFAAQKAAPAEVSGPWDVTSVELHQVQEDVPADILVNNNCNQTVEAMGLSIGWSDIITIGEKVWSIVEANKPVVTVTSAPTAAALPRGVNCWSDLAGWQAPKIQSYEVSYKNGFGIEVVKFRFRLQFNYGGGSSGKGKYLANVSVMPAEINVLWGYTFNADVNVEDAVNLGTMDSPMAGLGLNLKWTVKTVLKESDNSFHFFVQGDGVSTSTN